VGFVCDEKELFFHVIVCHGYLIMYFLLTAFGVVLLAYTSKYRLWKNGDQRDLRPIAGKCVDNDKSKYGFTGEVRSSGD
jgi:hypothetical protein